MISIIYGITAVVALALVIGYACFYKNKNIWLFLLFISVFLVNIGYFSISVSKILQEALLANRISYLGSVFLPFCMFMSVTDVCCIKIPKGLVATLLCVSAAVFVLAASPGYCDWYYKEVAFEIVDGTARLIKTYGKYHIVYLFYLLSYFGAMIAVVGYVIFKRKITSHKYGSMLTSVVFLNILIWLLEQLIPNEFEFLSISYIASEIIMLFLFSIMQDYDSLKKNGMPVVEEAVPETVIEAEVQQQEETALSLQTALILELWQPTEPLTARELEVLPLILDNCKRKDIAQRLCLSENTVKTHISHIFSKLEIEGRSELIEKANELLISRETAVKIAN